MSTPAIARTIDVATGLLMPISLGGTQIAMSRRQWSLVPYSSTPFMARTFKLSWKPCEAKT